MTPLRPWRSTLRGRPAFVLELSVAVAWFDPQRRSHYSHNVLLMMSSTIVLVPANWGLDLAEWMCGEESSGRQSLSWVEWAISFVYAFHIRVDPRTAARTWSHILPLAQLHTIAVPQAAYLELALRRKLPLATTDAPLVRAANAAGVPLFTP